MKFRILIILISIFASISCEHTSDIDENQSLNETNLDSLSTSNEDRRDSLDIVLNRNKIRTLNASTMVVGEEIRQLIFKDSQVFTIEELLEQPLTFTNNSGKIINVKVKSVVDTIF